MKKFLAVATVCLAGCLAVTATGCAKNTRSLAALSSNWYSDTDFKRIQPAFTEGDENFAPEKVTYTVSFKKLNDPARNSTYSVEYADGTYTTKFYAKKISEADLTDVTTEEWSDKYKEAIGKDGYLVVYCYETELKIPSVTFKFGDETRSFTDDYRHTISYFLSVEDYLSPVYSLQEIKSTTPAGMQPANIDNCYVQVDRIYENFYNLSGSTVLTEITDNLKEGDNVSTHRTGGLTDNTYSVFDNNYLDVVVRGMRNMSSSLSQNISTYAPTMVANYILTGSSTPLCDDADEAEKQLADIQKILEEKNLFAGKETTDDEGNVTKEKMKTVAVNVVYNNGEFTGVSQRYWFAAADSENKTRNLMVKYSIPLNYNLGSLEYVLENIESLPQV